MTKRTCHCCGAPMKKGAVGWGKSEHGDLCPEHNEEEKKLEEMGEVAKGGWSLKALRKITRIAPLPTDAQGKRVKTPKKVAKLDGKSRARR